MRRATLLVLLLAYASMSCRWLPIGHGGETDHPYLVIEVVGDGHVVVSSSGSTITEICEPGTCQLQFEGYSGGGVDRTLTAVDRTDGFIQWEDASQSNDVARCLFPGPVSTRAIDVEIPAEPFPDTDLAVECRVVFGTPPARHADPPEVAHQDSSLDIRVGVAARTPENGTWVAAEMQGPWPPSLSLYSWFVRVLLLGQSAETIAECVTEIHNGTPATVCPVGSASALEVRSAALGPVFIFDPSVTGAVSFRIETGVASTPTSGIDNDDLVGTIDSLRLAPPAPAP